MSQNNFKSKAPELLKDLADQVANGLVELLEIDQDKAIQIGNEIANRMAGHWGGQNLYFPMGITYALSKRDAVIYKDFTGDNHGELARKYGISLQWVYKIVKAARAQDIASRQRDIFQDVEE